MTLSDLLQLEKIKISKTCKLYSLKKIKLAYFVFFPKNNFVRLEIKSKNNKTVSIDFLDLYDMLKEASLYLSKIENLDSPGLQRRINTFIEPLNKDIK